MHCSLVFTFLFCVCGCKISFCNGKYPIENYDFLIASNIRPYEREIYFNYNDSILFCQRHNGFLAHMETPYLNKKAKDQLDNQISENFYVYNISFINFQHFYYYKS